MSERNLDHLIYDGMGQHENDHVVGSVRPSSEKEETKKGVKKQENKTPS